jgi:hypothetical protein
MRLAEVLAPTARHVRRISIIHGTVVCAVVDVVIAPLEKTAILAVGPSRNSTVKVG